MLTHLGLLLVLLSLLTWKTNGEERPLEKGFEGRTLTRVTVMNNEESQTDLFPFC